MNIEPCRLIVKKYSPRRLKSTRWMIFERKILSQPLLSFSKKAQNILKNALLWGINFTMNHDSHWAEEGQSLTLDMRFRDSRGFRICISVFIWSLYLLCRLLLKHELGLTLKISIFPQLRRSNKNTANPGSPNFDREISSSIGQ